MTHRTRMMLSSLALTALGAVGCSSQPQPAAPARPAVVHSVPPQPASPALAFTPSVALDADVPDLDRDGRGTLAYSGYESNVYSVTYTVTDDRQRWNRSGHDDGSFERRSISTSVTVRGQ